MAEHVLDELSRERLARLNAEWRLAEARSALAAEREQTAKRQFEAEIRSTCQKNGIRGAAQLDLDVGVLRHQEGEHDQH